MRHTKTVVIEAEGRDKGKIFVLREMSASQAERWATRALMLLTRAGIDLPEGVEKAGFAALAKAGFEALAHAQFAEIKPLLDEMWQCVQVQPDARNTFVRALQWEGPDGEGADIQEISTMLKLRMEVFTLHVGFSTPGINSNSSSQTTLIPGILPSTRTSPESTATRSPRRLPPGKRRS